MSTSFSTILILRLHTLSSDKKPRNFPPSLLPDVPVQQHTSIAARLSPHLYCPSGYGQRHTTLNTMGSPRNSADPSAPRSPQSQLNTSGASMSTSPRIDGKEFFRQARSGLAGAPPPSKDGVIFLRICHVLSLNPQTYTLRGKPAELASRTSSSRSFCRT